MESRCGILCGKCEWQKNGKCKGCVNIDNPFWGACPVKSYCEGRGLEHCGECSEFPCTRLVEFAYDENQGDCGVRLDQCKICKTDAVCLVGRLSDEKAGRHEAAATVELDSLRDRREDVCGGVS